MWGELFVSNPVSPYAVTYITQCRMEALATLCILGSLWLYMKRHLWLSGLVCVLGCMTKETAYITPGLIILYALCYENLRFRTILAMLIVGISLLGAGMFFNECLRTAVIGHKYMLSDGLLYKIHPVLMADIFCEYCKTLFLPLPWNLNIDPDYVPYQNNVYIVGLCGLFSSVLFYLCPQRKLLMFGAGALILSLLVPLLILPIKPDDKLVIYKSYLAIFPVSILAMAAMESILKHRILPVGIFIIACQVMVTMGVNQTFASEESLWRDAAMENPLRIRPIHNLGTTLLLKQEYDEALYWYNITLAVAEFKQHKGQPLTEIEKECVIRTYHHLGIIAMTKGDVASAINYFVKVRQLPEAQEWLKIIEGVLAQSK